MSRILYLSLLMPVLALSSPVHAEPSPREAAAGCQMCHRGALELTKHGADELRVRIEALRAGELTHPPTSLTATTDVAELARILSTGQASATP